MDLGYVKSIISTEKQRDILLQTCIKTKLELTEIAYKASLEKLKEYILSRKDIKVVRALERAQKKH